MVLYFAILVLVVFLIALKITNIRANKHEYYAERVFEIYDFMPIYTRVSSQEAPDDSDLLKRNAQGFRAQVISVLKHNFTAGHLKKLAKAKQKNASVTIENSVSDMEIRAINIAKKTIKSAKVAKALNVEQNVGKRRRRHEF